MMKLKMLKPRLTNTSTSRVQVVEPGSWRTGKTTPTARGYGYRWQQARAIYLREHPLCAYCKREGRTTLATVVDHKIPHRGNDALFWDEGNWRGLCARCHSSTKAREEHRDGLR